MTVVHINGLKIVLIHGLNVWDGGKGSIDLLKPLLYGLEPGTVVDATSADYGWQELFRVSYFWWVGDTIPKIARALEDADIVITHSNGANYCMKALRLINNPKLKIIHLSPALNKNYKFKEVFQSCDILYSRSDRIVWLAALIPFSRLGKMGNVGATTRDMRVRNNHQVDLTYKMPVLCIFWKIHTRCPSCVYFILLEF